jgi:hypothetical protein
MGLRLWGIALEPFCPAVKRSSASATSVRCQWRTFVASRSMPAATSASAEKSAACRSRATTCVDTVSGARPRAPRASASIRREVRVGPDGAGDLAHRDLFARRREPHAPRFASARCPRGPRPKVTGSAWIPWLRPIIGVPRCSRARSARASTYASAAASRPSARTSSSARLVSSTSLDVIPRWSHRAGGARELLDVREERDDVVLRRALDLVDARRVELRSWRGSARRPSPRDEPARSIASHAASSTSSHAA